MQESSGAGTNTAVLYGHVIDVHQLHRHGAESPCLQYGPPCGISLLLAGPRACSLRGGTTRISVLSRMGGCEREAQHTVLARFEPSLE